MLSTNSDEEATGLLKDKRRQEEEEAGAPQIGSNKPVIAAILTVALTLILFIVLVWVVKVTTNPTLAIQAVASVFSICGVLSTCYLVRTHVVSAAVEYENYKGSKAPESNTDWLKLLLSLRRRRYVMRLLGLVLVYTGLAGIAVWTAGNMVSVIMIELIACYEAFVTLQFYQWMVIQFADGTELTKSTVHGFRARTLAGGEGADEKSLLQVEGELLVVARSKVRQTWPVLVYQLRERIRLWFRERDESGKGCLCKCCLLRSVVAWDAYWRFFSNVAVISFCRAMLSLYLVANVVLLLVVVVCEPLGLYQNGALTANNVYPTVYVSRLMFLTPALWSLVWTLTVLREPLKSLSPVKKFATVKLIVFIGVWQRLALTFLRKKHHVPAGINPDESVPLLNNSLLCLEMFVAVFINFRVFRTHNSFSSPAHGLTGLLKELLPSQPEDDDGLVVVDANEDRRSAAREGSRDTLDDLSPKNGSIGGNGHLGPTRPEDASPSSSVESPHRTGPRWKNGRLVDFSTTKYLFSFTDVFVDVKADLGYLFGCGKVHHALDAEENVVV